MHLLICLPLVAGLAVPLVPPRVLAHGAGFVDLEIALTASLALVVREADVSAQDNLVERAVTAPTGEKRATPASGAYLLCRLSTRLFDRRRECQG